MWCVFSSRSLSPSKTGSIIPNAMIIRWMQPNLLSIIIYVLSKRKNKTWDYCVLILICYSHLREYVPREIKFCMRKAFITLISLGCKLWCCVTVIRVRPCYLFYFYQQRRLDIMQFPRFLALLYFYFLFFIYFWTLSPLC